MLVILVAMPISSILPLFSFIHCTVFTMSGMISASQEILTKPTMSLSEVLSDVNTLKSATSPPNFTFDFDFPLQPNIDNKEAERKLLWKCDFHVLPVLFIMYTLAFLDRINIGSAKIQGLMKELEMTGTQYNVALLIFFVPYILLEVCFPGQAPREGGYGTDGLPGSE